MDLKVMIEKQIIADRRRGFPVDFNTDIERHTQIVKDLVGLLGEIGEFANLTKKVGLKIDQPAYCGPTFQDAIPLLQEELADATIYIMRLSVILQTDLENDVLLKMSKNDLRYQKLKTPEA